jgi:hypothetical protein
VGALHGRLDVDEGRLRQQQLDGRPSAEPVGPQAVAQLGQQHAQRVARLRGGVLAPAGHEQRIARQLTATVEDEVGEQGSASAAGQRVFDAGSVDDDDEATTELDPGLGPLAHQATSRQRSLSLRGGKHTERTGKGQGRVQASSNRHDLLVI